MIKRAKIAKCEQIAESLKEELSEIHAKLMGEVQIEVLTNLIKEQVVDCNLYSAGIGRLVLHGRIIILWGNELTGLTATLAIHVHTAGRPLIIIYVAKNMIRSIGNNVEAVVHVGCGFVTGCPAVVIGKCVGNR